ncbi:hypothetical protein D3C73_701700 [compost metagenome]
MRIVHRCDFVQIHFIFTQDRVCLLNFLRRNILYFFELGIIHKVRLSLPYRKIDIQPFAIMFRRKYGLDQRVMAQIPAM